MGRGGGGEWVWEGCIQAHHHQSGVTPSEPLHRLISCLMLFGRSSQWFYNGSKVTEAQRFVISRSPSLSDWIFSLLPKFNQPPPLQKAKVRDQKTGSSSLFLWSPHWLDLEGFEIYGFRDSPVGEADAPVASTMLPLNTQGCSPMPTPLTGVCWLR